MGNLDANLERVAALEGMGCSRKRREDPRFIQGKGTYVDDVKMPGMLFGAMVRSPYAHARIKSIDKSRALAFPGVHAVLTADDLKPLKLHWMPTLAGDVQAVLADEKVCFQNQEVAFVVADDRYVAADAAELVEVEYEELPAVVDPFRALEPDAPVIREDIRDKDNHAIDAAKYEFVITHDLRPAEFARDQDRTFADFVADQYHPARTSQRIDTDLDATLLSGTRWAISGSSYSDLEA